MGISSKNPPHLRQLEDERFCHHNLTGTRSNSIKLKNNNNNNNNNNQHHVGQSERNGIEYDGGDSQEDDLLEDGQGKLRRQGKRSSEYRRRTQQPPQGKGQRHLATRKKDHEG